MTTLVRLTQHDASENQSDEIRRIFGNNVKVIKHSETLPNDPRAAVARFDEIVSEHGANFAEAVLPVGLLEAILKFSQFCKNGGIVVRATLSRVVAEDGKASFVWDDKSYYEQVKKVEIVTERLSTTQP